MADPREKIVKYREQHDISRKQLADRLGISEVLVGIIENGGVTVPGIAKRIGKLCQLTYLEIEELMPLNRRKHGGRYDPDKYVIEPIRPKQPTLQSVRETKGYKDDYIYYGYVADKTRRRMV